MNDAQWAEMVNYLRGNSVVVAAKVRELTAHRAAAYHDTNLPFGIKRRDEMRYAALIQAYEALENGVVYPNMRRVIETDGYCEVSCHVG